MSESTLIRLCKLPADLGVGAGLELHIDPGTFTLYVAAPPGYSGANGVVVGRPLRLADFVAAHPEAGDPIRAFVVGRMTGQPKAYEEERRERLAELVSGITDDNRHAETDWGPPVGREVW
jgi:antitoxin component of MazEF toxin-antitoxin module